jgi:Tfp pilus assembly protein PilN
MPDFKSLIRSFRQVMLAVSIEPGRLVAHRCVKLGFSWQVERSERFPLDGAEPTPDAIAAALRPLVLRWALPAATPVVLLAAPLIGGILAVVSPLARNKDCLWIDQELTKLLPFAPRELETGITLLQRGGKQTAEVFWLPKGWVADLKAALGRIGLRLDEILARAQLLAPLPVLGKPVKKAKSKRPAEDRSPQAAVKEALKAQPAAAPVVVQPEPVELLIEGEGEALYFHCYRNGVALRSRTLPGEMQAAADAVLLELMALEGQGIRPTRLTLRGPLSDLQSALQAVELGKLEMTRVDVLPDLPAAFCAAWQRDVHGVWVVPERKQLLAKLYRAGFALAAVAVVVCGALSWATDDAKNESEQLETEAKRLKPRYQKVVAIEKQAVEASRLLAAMDAVNAASATPVPLDALFRVYEALPEKAWVTHFASRADGSLVVSGRGAKNDDVLAKLRQSPNIADAKAGTPEEGAPEDSFAIEAHWRPAPPPKPASPAPAAAAQPPAAPVAAPATGGAK